MITYQSYVYSQAISAASQAIKLALSLAQCVSQQDHPEYEDLVRDQLSNLQSQFAVLQDAANKLLSALPAEIRSQQNTRHGLLRHIYWIRIWLDKGQPEECAGDPLDIAEDDLPRLLSKFDQWYERQSPVDQEFADRIGRFVADGELNTAVREAWVIFKTRMVERYELSQDLDGHRLADELFGPNGKAAPILEYRERQGYLNLFKGLYTLSRNPVAHNDVAPSPRETDAVLALIDSALGRLTKLRSEH